MDTQLCVASLNGHTEIVNVLIREGADVNKAHKDGCTPLYVASENGHTEIVNVLIKEGADVNKAHNDGWTPLYVASENVTKYSMHRGLSRK